MQLEYKVQKSFKIFQDKKIYNPVDTTESNMINKASRCIKCNGVSGQKNVDR